MNENCLNKLEYDCILNLLSKQSTTYIGKKMCLELLPTLKKDKVEKILQETLEAYTLIIKKDNLPINEISNIDVSIKNLESSNSLNISNLLNISYILRLARELKEYFYGDKDFDCSSFPILDNYFSSLYSNKKIEEQILSSILDENNIADSASNVLANLRRNRRKLEGEIKESLNTMIHSPLYSKYIMESLVTVRNDRYVIPVKEEFRSYIKGFIHDVSSSGSTVFIEPISVFELNNKISNLKIEESVEIERILLKLSSLLFPITFELKQNVNLIGLLDFIFAKAKLAKLMDAHCPKINTEKNIYLEKARHPLIDNQKVVPIDIEIGKNYTCLIITGPNTGGKTVALKTVGLLTLMACSGMFIPASENSSIYVFDNIFADIGDEQSIQESLSTFSAHMTNIAYILNNVSCNSLVLVDELGSGTDPVEGASLATAILEHLNKIGAITISTTHYQEIKNYALVTDGFENASSEFDVENMKPTYKLLIGIPGKSNAFAISKKLGISNEILQNAHSLLKKDNINIEELLKSIYDNKIKIEHEKSEIDKNLHQVELLRKSLEQENKSKRDTQIQIVEKAKLEAQNAILSAKEDANTAIKKIEEIYSKWKILDSLNSKTLNDSELANIVRPLISSNPMQNVNQIRSKLNTSLDTFYTNNNKTANISKKDLNIGTHVQINNINGIATVISLSGKNNKIQVQYGNAKMTVNIKDIYNIITNNSIDNHYSSISFSNSINKSKNVNTEINIIGQTVDDACFVVDKFLDDAYIAKLPTIRIVHGKGTGKLREGIHIFLRKHPHVKNFRLGTFGEGEMGVTIVTLKEK